MLHLLLDLAPPTPPGWTATLPPEIQHALAILAALTLLAGLLVWAAGVKIARLAVALALGLLGAAILAPLLPRALDVTPLTAGILGFVAGALLGIFTFRLLQGLTLALCLGLAVAGLYYQWHVPHQQPAPSSTRAADLLTRTNQFPLAPASAPNQPKFTLASTLKTLGDQLNSIPPQHYRRLLIVGIGTASVALLLAFGFPRFTTWIITALVGSLMILISAHALASLYFPAFKSLFPTHTLPRYLLLAFLILLGLLIQYRTSPPPADTHRKQAKPPEPKPA